MTEPHNSSKFARFIAAIVGALLIACSAHPARFAGQDPVRRINDDRPSPVPSISAEIEPVYLSEVYVRQPLIQALTLERVSHARDVNAWDEVPDSTWYQKRSLTAGAEAAYSRAGPPLPPLSVRRRDSRGSLSVVDRRGEEYRLRRDPLGLPRTATAAAAITSRLFWALGYNSTEVHVLSVSLSDFASDSEALRSFLQSDDVGRSLRVAAEHEPRAIALGLTEDRGTRSGDPNDAIRAENRRTLRALAMFGWWLEAPTMGRLVTRDYYVGEPGAGHTRHYLTPVDQSLGVTSRPSPYESRADADPTRVRGNALTNFVTLGLKKPATRPRGTTDPLRDLSPHINPRFRLRRPYYPASHLRLEDAYWASKLILQLPDAILEWAVASADLADQELEAALVAKLHARRRDLAGRLFTRVTACELIGIEGDELKLVDLARANKLLTRDLVSYRVTLLDEFGKPFSGERRVLSESPEFPVKLPGSAAFEYMVVRIERRKSPDQVPPVEVHLHSDGSVMRVVGLRH